MPTKAGGLLLLGGLATAGAGRLLGPLEFIVAGFVATAAVLLAVAIRHIRKSRLTISRLLSSSRVEAGQPVRVDLEVHNVGRHRTPLLRLQDSISSTRGVRLSLAPIRRNGSVIASYRLPTTRRGVITLGPVTVDDTDAGALARRRHTFTSLATLLVHPAIEFVPEIPILSGHDPMMGDQQKQALGISDEEFDGLREYQPGDDLRKVHWPSSARHDELLVRRFQPPRHGRVTLVVDVRPPGDVNEVLDITTSIAASIASSVLSAGDSVRIQTTQGLCTSVINGSSNLIAGLEFLALLDSGAPDIHESVPAIGGKVVVISADPRLPDTPTARSGLASRLSASALITVDHSDWNQQNRGGVGGPGWAHLTGPGQIAMAWRTLWSRRPVTV